MKATASMENRIYFRSYFLFLKFYLCFCLEWENESWLSIVVHFFRSLLLSRNSNLLHSYNDPKDNREWFFSRFFVDSLSLAAVALFQIEIFIMKNFGICECRYCVWLLFSLNVRCGLRRMRQHHNYRICGIVKCVMFFSVLFCCLVLIFLGRPYRMVWSVHWFIFHLRFPAGQRGNEHLMCEILIKKKIK